MPALQRAAFRSTELYRNWRPRLGVQPSAEGSPPIVASFTSIPARSATVHLTAASLLRQTLRPARVVLWVSEDYPITRALQRLERRGLEIRRIEDIGPYCKLIPSLQQFPDALVATFDDDFIYRRDTLEWLHRSWRRDRSAVHAMKARRITRSDGGGLAPFDTWKAVWHDDSLSPATIPMGSRGVLYPPGAFGKGERLEVFNSEVFREIAPRADDIWFKAMHLRAGTAVRLATLVPASKPIQLPLGGGPSLWGTNSLEGRYDQQIKAVFERYDLMGSF